MLLRAALVLCAVAAVVFGITRLHKDDSCQHTRQVIVDALFHRHYPAGGLNAPQQRLIAACRDRDVLAAVSVVETTAGLYGPSSALARRATRDEPRNIRGWAALAQALDRSDPHAAAAARARVRVLDPQGQVPAALRGRAPLSSSPR